MLKINVAKIMENAGVKTMNKKNLLLRYEWLILKIYSKEELIFSPSVSENLHVKLQHESF